MRVVVTGANGFVGKHLIDALTAEGHEVVGTVRRRTDECDLRNLVVIPEGGSHESALHGAEVLIHTAGLAHRPSASPAEFERVNRDWTVRLAGEAAVSKVRTVINLSSIAARETVRGRATPYGRSKLDAEPAIEALAESGILGINLRPPVIFGSGAPGNWSKLVRLADSPWPLPFGAVRNRRSYLFIGNLVGAVLSLTRFSDARLAGTYELADREQVSLADVLAAIRAGLGRPARLVPFPVKWMEFPLRWAGKNVLADGLFSDLDVDSTRFEKSFDWSPDRSTLEAMKDSVGKA